MKKAAPFITGFVAGVLSTILVLYLYINSDTEPTEPYDGLYGLTTFQEKGECIPTDGRIEVFQVLKPNMALARTGKYLNGAIILLINYEGKSYYDDQEIKIPSGKCARQIGSYQYTTTNDFEKTVPAVAIE